MEEWQKILSKFYEIKPVSKNCVIIKCGIFDHTQNCYIDNVLRQLWADEDNELFIDSLEITYRSIYEYLGFEDKEDYDKNES